MSSYIVLILSDSRKNLLVNKVFHFNCTYTPAHTVIVSQLYTRTRHNKHRNLSALNKDNKLSIESRGQQKNDYKEKLNQPTHLSACKYIFRAFSHPKKKSLPYTRLDLYNRRCYDCGGPRKRYIHIKAFASWSRISFFLNSLIINLYLATAAYIILKHAHIQALIYKIYSVHPCRVGGHYTGPDGETRNPHSEVQFQLEIVKRNASLFLSEFKAFYKFPFNTFTANMHATIHSKNYDAFAVTVPLCFRTFR